MNENRGKIDERTSHYHIGNVTHDLLQVTWYDDLNIIELYRSVVNTMLYSHHHPNSYLVCDSGSYEFEEIFNYVILK